MAKSSIQTSALDVSGLIGLGLKERMEYYRKQGEATERPLEKKLELPEWIRLIDSYLSSESNKKYRKRS